MKVPAAAPAALLLVSICSSAEVHHDMIPTACCFSYMHRPIPRSLIISTYKTSGLCSLPAAIVVTKTGRNVCVDPQARWVQAHLKHSQTLEY
ncbi:CCL3 protein, partial [Balaeniceps rex]|nr:CCL3 protein [Balaeniceps rex]